MPVMRRLLSRKPRDTGSSAAGADNERAAADSDDVCERSCTTLIRASPYKSSLVKMSLDNRCRPFSGNNWTGKISRERKGAWPPAQRNNLLTRTQLMRR
jgi:hypothetical protein